MFDPNTIDKKKQKRDLLLQSAFSIPFMLWVLKGKRLHWKVVIEMRLKNHVHDVKSTISLCYIVCNKLEAI